MADIAAQSTGAPYKVAARRDASPATIDRPVPVLPFSRESAKLPQLRKSLALYRLAFGQPRQEELVEFLGDRIDPDHREHWLSQLRIDLTPPSRQEHAWVEDYEPGNAG